MRLPLMTGFAAGSKEHTVAKSKISALEYAG
jgi:hypothetical protein